MITLEFQTELIEAVRTARHIVVLTGSGISAESGIATFRDPMTGLWARYQPEEMATAAAFQRDPALVWGWYEWRRMQVLRAAPNPGHHAIVSLAARVPRLTLITQNVDDLHERAGSQNVLHLHGRLDQPFCFDCRRPHTLVSGIADEPEGGRRLEPPRCSHCGGRVRPGVVWFGEGLPAEVWREAVDACADCDLMLTVGTSSVVQPAASLSFEVARRQRPVVQVNPQATDLNQVTRFNLAGMAGEVLPALVAAMS